jgi:hypothetical protein
LRAAKSLASRLVPRAYTGGSGCCSGFGHTDTVRSWKCLPCEPKGAVHSRHAGSAPCPRWGAHAIPRG